MNRNAIYIYLSLFIGLQISHAQSVDCDLNNGECRDTALSQQCVRHEATVESCRVLIDRLEQNANSQSAELRLTLGLAYTVASSKIDIPDEREESLALAESIFQALLEENPGNVEAVVGLTAIARRRQDADELEFYLRRRLELQPSDYAARLLADELLGRGQAGIAEAFSLYRDMYESSSDLLTRLRHAESLYQLYLRHNEDGLAQQLRMSVLENEIDIETILSELSNADSLRSAELESHLTLLCGAAVKLLGTANCIEGVDRAVRAVSNSAINPGAETIDAVIAGIQKVLRLGETGILDMASGSNRPAILTEWVNNILSTGYRSAALSVTQARLAEDLELRRSHLEEAVSLDPGNGGLKVYLGQTYAELERWQEALSVLREAKQQLPEDMSSGADHWIHIVETNQESQ